MVPSMRHIVCLASLSLFLACGGGDDTTEPVVIPVASVSVTPATLTLTPGETAQLTATPRAADTSPLTDRAVSWTSTDPAVASVSSTGLVTAVTPGGPIAITATSEGKAATAQVTVSPTPVATVETSPATTSIEAGDTTRFVATLRSATGAELTGRTIAWSSANTAIAAVDATSGLVTGIAPGGPVHISATSEGKQASSAVTITAPTVATVAVTPAAPSVEVGKVLPLAVTLRDVRGNAITGRPITWSSSNPGVATVDQDGQVTGVSIGGPVTITASSEGRQGMATLTVHGAPVARVDVTAPTPEMADDATMQLSVRLTDASGNVLAGRTISWTSDAPTVATVDATGLVRPVRAGVVTVRARSEGIEGTATITVRGLVNRWTFSEEGGLGTTFRDDVGGRVAVIAGSTATASAIGGQVTLAGGAQTTAGYVALPAGLLRPLTDATIEVWATMHAIRTWARIIHIGNGTANNLFVAWSQGRNPTQDRVGFTVNGVEQRLDNSMAPFRLDMQHHVVMALDEGGGANGRTKVTLFLDGSARGAFDTDYRLAQLADADFFLGRSHYNDETANASFDEVRIHNRAFALADAQRSYVRGPIRTGTQFTVAILPPVGMRDTVRGVDVRFALQASGRDAHGRQFPLAGARWTTSAPTIATVDSTGLVHARAAGRAEITATVGTTTARWSTAVVRSRRLNVDPYLATPIAGALWEVPVILIEYLPTADGSSLDVLKAPDFWFLNAQTLDSVEANNLRIAKRRKMMVEQGSRFRGYKDPAATPSLGYRVIEHIIVYDQIPPHPTKRANIAGSPRYEHWHGVFSDLGLDPIMRARTVRELWVAHAAFDGGFPSYDATRHKVEDMRVGWESNMSSPTTGDISNSDRDPNDAPLLPHTYIIYGINYRRSQAEAGHNVGHQVEAMFSHIAHRQDGNADLFWRKFVGLDGAGRFVPGRVGATHFPPNAASDYDYGDPRMVASDIEDWRPDNSGQKTQVNVDTWGKLVYPWPGEADFGQRVESQWYTYWFQNMPGRGNRITHGSNWMTNWWAFVADWDAAFTSGLGLYGGSPAASQGPGTAPTAIRAGPPYRPPAERPPARRPR